jgi:hypothetical protein
MTRIKGSLAKRNFDDTNKRRHGRWALIAWSDGVMGIERKNKNRDYQQLRVWEDAINLYAATC